jgi:hypothetical protein
LRFRNLFIPLIFTTEDRIDIENGTAIAEQFVAYELADVKTGEFFFSHGFEYIRARLNCIGRALHWRVSVTEPGQIHDQNIHRQGTLRRR